MKRMMRELSVTGLAILAATAMGRPASAQTGQSFIAVSFSEPYSSNSFGVDAAWASHDGILSVHGFASTFPVDTRAGDVKLFELTATRALGSSGLPSHLLVTTGFRWSREDPRAASEFAIPVLVGARFPIVRAGAFDMNFEAQFGRARRQLRNDVIVVRANRFSLSVGMGRFLLNFGHDDVDQSNTPFNYGGASRLSVGWRF